MKDLTNSSFGYWTVIKQVENRHGKRMWLCECKCGRQSTICTSDLTRVRSKGCVSCSNKKTEGFIYREHYLYSTYCGMKQRCYDVNFFKYNNYGGRGITVCDEWLGREGFETFLKDMGDRPKGYTLDRIDNDKGYSPKNCKWSSLKEQANNKRKNFTFRGVSYRGLAGLAKAYNIIPQTLHWRVNNGWDLEKALNL